MRALRRVRKFSKSRKSSRVEWGRDKKVEIRVKRIIRDLDLSWVKRTQVHCFRSQNSTSRAYARIWGLPRIWQLALSENPTYIIEVLSERFDRLNQLEQDKVLLHELAHIPKNFSGSLLPHIRKRGKRNFEDRVRTLVTMYKRKLT